jgi:hypothetical protein
MSETTKPESVVSTSGPLPPVNVTINLPPPHGYCKVACPPGLTLRQKQRLLRAAKKQINAALYEVYKTLELLEQVRRM